MLFSSLRLLAELPPYVYDALQKNAPESLLIKVDSVRTSSSMVTENAVTVEAEVINVIRSKSGLRKGDRITIAYSTFASRPGGWVGPSPIPVLEKDKIYSAFLKKDAVSNLYLPAAKGRSFK